MSKDGNKLNVVDDAGNIVGVETRDKIHKEGLLHKEIHVWLCTPHGEILLQHRVKDKELFPDLLDASVGGHVEIGEEFKDAALKELREETGINANENELIFIQITNTKNSDSRTGNINNALRAVYAYKYAGKIDDLKIEEGKSQGFVALPIGQILGMSEEEKKRFCPDIFGDKSYDVLKKIQLLP